MQITTSFPPSIPPHDPIIRRKERIHVTKRRPVKSIRAYYLPTDNPPSRTKEGNVRQRLKRRLSATNIIKSILHNVARGNETRLQLIENKSSC